MEVTKFGTIKNQGQNSRIISLKVKHLVPNGLLLILATNLYFHKKRTSLLITNINLNLGDSVAEGTVSEPIFHLENSK